MAAMPELRPSRLPRPRRRLGLPSVGPPTLAALVAAVSLSIGRAPAAEADEATWKEDNPLSWEFLDPGTFELSLSLAGSYSDGGGDAEATTLGGRLFIGVLLDTHFEVGVKAEGSWSDTTLQSDDPAGPTTVKQNRYDVYAGPVFLYNIPASDRLIPFFQASGGIVYSEVEVDGSGSGSELGAYWDAGTGVRYFVKPFASLNVTLLFRQFFLEEQSTVNTIVGAVGVSLFF